MKLIALIYKDHFSSDREHEKDCFAFCCGVEIPLADSIDYIRLMHINADNGNPASAKEFHNILIAAIVHREEIELPETFRISLSIDDMLKYREK